MTVFLLSRLGDISLFYIVVTDISHYWVVSLLSPASVVSTASASASGASSVDSMTGPGGAESPSGSADASVLGVWLPSGGN